jgi:uncharacterized membrane protein YbaN (DUF454 family)
MSSLKNFLVAYSLFAAPIMEEIATSAKWKAKILEKWEESKNFPRKKKKKIRKELQLDWSIACYNPYDF